MSRRMPRAGAWPVAALVLPALLAGCPGGVGGPDKDTAKALAQLRSKDSEDRQAAITKLARKRGQEARVVPALIDALRGDDPMVQKMAAGALRSLLGRPDLTDSPTVWEEEWRRAKARKDKEKGLSPKENLRKEKAKLKNDEGVLLMARGDLQEAEALFLEAIAQDPENPMYWSNLGKCNTNEGRFPIAIDRFLKALEHDPGYAAAHYNLADTYLKMSKLSPADRTYEALGHVGRALALDRHRRDWAARRLKAEILMLMATREKRPAEKTDIFRRAAEAVDEAIEIEPKSAEVRKTAALIAYFRELYHRSYKEVMKIYELGYEVDREFLEELWVKLRREYINRGLEPPPMPKSKDRRPEGEGPPPSLRAPYGEGDR